MRVSRTLDEAAHAIAEYLPGRKPYPPQRLTCNLRQRSDGRWEWKHGLGRNRPRPPPSNRQTTNRGIGGHSPQEWTKKLPHLTCPVLVMRGQRSDVLSDVGA